MSLTKFLSIALSLLLFFYILIIGKSLLLPLVIAIVIWYIILAISSYFKKIEIKGKNIPDYLAKILSFFVFALVIWMAISILQVNIGQMIVKAPVYQEKIQTNVATILLWFGKTEAPTLSKTLDIIGFPSLLGFMTDLLANLASYGGMTLVYLILIFLEYKIIDTKIKMFINDDEKYIKFKEVMKKIDADIKTYITIKTGVSLMTAVLSFIILYFAGIDFPLFWAMLIFILNFIPTIGSIIAVIFPLALSLIQFGTFTPFIILLILLITVQIVMGNILEPKLMGKSLNISPLVIVLALGVWGSVWGVVGMFLSIPIMVIVNIILAKIPKTRGLAVMFSARGKV